MPQGHGEVENGVRRAWAVAIGWVKGLQESKEEILTL